MASLIFSRRSKRMNLKGLKSSEKISDKRMLELFLTFRTKYIENSEIEIESSALYQYALLGVIENMKVEDLSWAILTEIASNELLTRLVRSKSLRIYLRFLIFAAETNNYYGEDKQEILDNKLNIMKLIESNTKSICSDFQKNNIRPKSVVVWQNGRFMISTIIESRNAFLLELFKNYLETTIAKDLFSIYQTITMFSYFETAISPLIVNCYDDFNDDVFFNCVRGMLSKFGYSQDKSVASRVVVFFQWMLITLPTSVIEHNFSCVNTVVLSFYRLVSKLNEGYEVIKYSPYETPKYVDKMLILPSSDRSHILGESGRIYSFNISEINNHLLKKWYTDFYWKGTGTELSTRTKVLSEVFCFLKELDKQIERDDKDLIITETHVANYCSKQLTKNNANATISRSYGQLRKLFVFLEREYKFPIKPIFYQMLVYKDNDSAPNKDAFTGEEISKIIMNIYEDKPLYAMAVSIFAETEMRAESVLGLKIDCLNTELESKGRNEYSVSAHTKRSDDEMESININHYAKTYIDEALKLSEDARKNANSHDKEYLFIYLPVGKVIPRRYKQDSLTRVINTACASLGIEPKGAQGIRNYTMQSIGKQGSKKGFNSAIISKLSGHTLARQVKNYDEVDMTEFCQNYYHVNIGNVELRGKIEEKTELGTEAKVVGSCGFCSEKHCNLAGKLDCFMCKSFITTLSCMPFYEEAIEKINIKIISETISHEKDFLLSKKKLLVAYMSKLMELKGGLALNEQSNYSNN
jgi:integrase